jgi:hypothetical protein
MQYALINNNKVENIIVADQEFIDAISNQYQHIESLDQPGEHNIGVGWSWNQNDGFYAPEPEPEPNQPSPKKITQLAFISRFTDAEAIALDLASIGSTVEAASIRRYMQKVNAATFIDLERADTISGVNQLEAVGLIGAGRANAILTAPITEQEIAR